ncbi:MAG TPA: hypothetical protein DEH78_17645 [Solibacterales bacterium]|nr:hypothetical protein [Bryobacterales bacterium]
MDLSKALTELYEERRRLDSAISALESMMAPAPANTDVRRRGRKSMGAMERLVVSERMKRYWASRRQEPSGVVELPMESTASA